VLRPFPIWWRCVCVKRYKGMHRTSSNASPHPGALSAYEHTGPSPVAGYYSAGRVTRYLRTARLPGHAQHERDMGKCPYQTVKVPRRRDTDARSSQAEIRPYGGHRSRPKLLSATHFLYRVRDCRAASIDPRPPNRRNPTRPARAGP